MISKDSVVEFSLRFVDDSCEIKDRGGSRRPVESVRLIYASKLTGYFLLFAPTARSRRVVDFSLVTLEISPSYSGVLAKTSWTRRT